MCFILERLHALIYLPKKTPKNQGIMILAQIFAVKKHQKTKTNLIAKSKPNPAASVATK